MKFTGAALVFAVMTILGIMISSRLKRRTHLLEKTLLFIGSMKLDFEYSALPLDRIIEKYADCQSYSSINFIRSCYDEIKNGADFPVAWKKSVSTSTLYTQNEINKLLELGDLLGTSDSSGQIGILKIYEEYFENFYKAADKMSEKYGETSIMMGLFIGIGIFVLLI